MAKFSSNFFEFSSIQSSDETIEASQFSIAIHVHEVSAEIGEGLMCVSSEAVISGSSVHSSRYRNYRWGDSSSIFGPNMASKAISERLI